MIVSQRLIPPPRKRFLNAQAASIGVGLVGYGYWGPNLARNFSVQPGCTLQAICELDPKRRALAQRQYPQARLTDRYEDLLGSASVDAVLIATPVGTHHDLARRALQAGKDVLVEKPLAATVTQAEELARLAKDTGRILAVDHTFLFTGAVQKMKQLVDSGELGDLLYVDSVRVNLGLFQHDVNVIYDLAPHDLSIVGYLLGRRPVSVQAMGSRHPGNELETHAYLHLEYAGGVTAHFHVNWLSPVKIRRMLVGGARKTIVFDDMEPSEKVLVYDSGVVLRPGDVDSLYKVIVDYRTGDMVAPKLARREALAAEAEHFLACVKDRSQPLADAAAGLDVVRILEAAQASLAADGARIRI